MGAALHLLHTEITGIVKSSIVFRLDEGQLVEHRVSVASFVEQQLGALVEGYQEILIRIVAGLNKLRQRVAGAFDLIAPH